MTEETIGQRLKLLVDSLKISVRKFAQTIDTSETNIRNYYDRGTKPSSDVLEKIVIHFPQTNMVWLLTGKGDPFLSQIGDVAEPLVSFQKNNYGNNVGSNRGMVSQEATHASSDTEKLQTALAMAQQEIENLKIQLSMQAALLAAKDETIDLLKSAFTRPN